METIVDEVRAIEGSRRSELIRRLKLEEQDLNDRLTKHVLALEHAGRERTSDPLYQRLAGVLGTVRRQLANEEKSRSAGGGSGF